MSFRSNASQRFFAMILSLLGVCVGLFIWIPTTEAQSVQGGLQLLQSDTNRIVLELTADSYSTQVQTINGARYVIPTISGMEPTNENGKPQLPMKGTLVAIPPGAQASLKILLDEPQSSSLSASPIPVPSLLGPSDPTQTLPQASITVFKPDATTYSANKLYPRDIARINADSMWRSQRVLSIGLYPLQVNPDTRQVILHRRLRIEITFTYPRGRNAQSLGSSVNEGVFEQVFQQSIFNYSSSRNWRSISQSANPRQSTTLPSVTPLYRVSLNQDGMYQITCAQLATAGIAMPMNLNYARMFKQGTELAIYTNGTCNNPGDSGFIEFFGQATNTKYTTTNVYWLTPGNGLTPHVLMPTRDGSGAGTTPSVFTETLHVEENHYYRPAVPINVEGADHWYSTFLGGMYGSKNFPFQLTGLATAGVSATITTRMTVFSGTAFNTDTTINGNVVGTVGCVAINPCNATVQFNSSLLGSGTNMLTLNADQLVFYNNFDLIYPATFTAITDTLRFRQATAGTWRYSISNFSSSSLEAFDITNPFSVTRFINLFVNPGTTNTLQFSDLTFTAREYITLAFSQRKAPLSITPYTPANLGLTSNGADYIAIAYRDFMTETKRLTDFRASQGMRVKLVDIQSVYDEYNDGVLDPLAIRSFFSDTLKWQTPRPQFVLLVGDGHWDPLGFCINVSNCPGSLATPPNSIYIPAYLRMADPYTGETATDNQLVSFDDTHLPWFSIGRLPADSVADVTAMVNKILSNEQSPPQGQWRNKVSFVSGDSYWSDGRWDDGGAGNSNGFWGFSDSLIAQYPQFSPERIYFNACPPSVYPQCVLPYPTFPTVTGVEAATTSAINAGRLIVNYIGHSSPVAWQSKGTPSPWFFASDPSTQDDVTPLTNGARMPVMLEMTCFTGMFQIPYFSPLGEANVRRANGGALASFAATGQGLAIGHDRLDVGFFDAVIKNGTRYLGLATDAGKVKAIAYTDLLDTFILFGDPASRLQIQLPSYLPLIKR